ncbi:heme-binding protein [Telmatospirillum sp. J64-1]|uniref:GlcG/HbpS family heme-binding protein n=1 Tax=Telmatospirillum sp. J64-1 TaxID=2502183 RepID=UPI00115D84E2|nr:heme-binding protein [Telmatospirillum sp. J64-1]
MAQTSSRPALNLPGKAVLTLEAARLAVAEAEEEAKKNGLRLSIAVVDDGGHLLHFARMDGVHAGTVDVAVAKARTAALFKKPTQVFADALKNGTQAMLSLPNMLLFPGGVPLFFKGECVGAIGVSGASPDMDAKVAEAGAAILAD